MKKYLEYLFITVAVLICMTVTGSIEADQSQIEKNVAVIIPYQGYSHRQYTTLKETFEKAGISMKIVSTQIGKAKHTPNGRGLETDLTIDSLNTANFDAFIFIGSVAGLAAEYVDNPDAHAVARAAYGHNKVIAALCNGPAIFANAGILQGRKIASIVPTDVIKKAGAEPSYANMTIDGNIITATRVAIDSMADAVVDKLMQTK